RVLLRGWDWSAVLIGISLGLNYRMSRGVPMSRAWALRRRVAAAHCGRGMRESPATKSPAADHPGRERASGHRPTQSDIATHTDGAICTANPTMFYRTI